MWSHWLVLAVIPPVLYAINSHIDKAVVDVYLDEREGDGVGIILLFSTLLSLFGVFYPVIQDATVVQFWAMDPTHLLVMLLVGVLNVMLLYCYLKALEGDGEEEGDETVAVLYYQLVPVFALVMASVILKELPSKSELWPMLMILVGTTIASVRVDELKELHWRAHTAKYMTLAALCWAGETTLGKIVIIEASVYHAVFWESVAMVFLGAVLLIARPSYAKSFAGVWGAAWCGQKQAQRVLFWLIVGEAIYAAGNTIIAFAIELQHVTNVLLLQPLQTVFVFLLGVLILQRLPWFNKEPVSVREGLQKTVAILITGVGTYWLLQVSPDIREAMF